MKHILYQRLHLSTNCYFFVISLAILSIIATSCNPKKKVEIVQTISEIKIIPAPAKILYKRDYFILGKSTRILLNLSNEESKKIGENLIKEIQKKTSYKLKIADRFTTNKIASGIEIIMGNNKNIKPEGFKIVISGSRIKILSNDSNGLYYASKVVKDLLYKIDGSWKAPQVIIEDHPNTEFRGIFLNIPDSILNKPELLALLKTNRINYLITSKNWNSPDCAILNIGDTAMLPIHWQQHLMKGQNIKEFYLNGNRSNEVALFYIKDKSLLHPDSLSILGEAMWSKPSKRDYQKLIGHLGIAKE